MNPTQQADMTRQVLATSLDIDGDTRAFRDAAVARITVKDGGMKYYDAEDDLMLFEKLGVETLVTYLEEEVLDIPNYAAMLSARGVDPALLSVVVEQAYLQYVMLDVIRRSIV